jgi:DNA-binding transcriptional MerR regulator
MLNITVRTLLRWHRQGIGPPRRRTGNGLRYRTNEIEDWLSLNPRHRATNPALPDAA